MFSEEHVNQAAWSSTVSGYGSKKDEVFPGDTELPVVHLRQGNIETLSELSEQEE